MTTLLSGAATRLQRSGAVAGRALAGARSGAAVRARAALARVQPGIARAGRAAAPVARPVAAAVGPVLGVVGAVGWFVIVGALASGIAGALLGWPELTYLSLTLLGALAISAAFLIGRADYRVALELEPPRVTVGDRAYGRLVVANSAARRSLPSRMELPVGAGLAEFTIPSLAPEAEHDELFAVPTHRRAVIVAGPALTVRGDQLGILRRTVRWTDPVELFVHPIISRLQSSAAGLVRDLEGEITPVITSNDIAFHALRAYEPGDPLRNVHWRTSARTGQLMVRQFNETRRSELLLVQSIQGRSWADEDEFELGVSVMASLGVQVVRDATRLTVVTESGMLRTATPTTLLDDTSRIELQPLQQRPLRAVVRDITRRTPAPSVMVLVIGSQTTIEEARSVTSLFRGDTQSIVMRVEQGANPGLSRIGQTVVATIGSLSDLRGIIRAVKP
jgi:uncharacterized protein (DUF58 family)